MNKSSFLRVSLNLRGSIAIVVATVALAPLFLQLLCPGDKLASRVGDVLLVTDKGSMSHALQSHLGTRRHKNHLLINAALRIVFPPRPLGTCGAVAGVVGCHPVAATFLRAQTAVVCLRPPISDRFVNQLVTSICLCSDELCFHISTCWAGLRI